MNGYSRRKNSAILFILLSAVFWKKEKTALFGKLLARELPNLPGRWMFSGRFHQANVH